MNLEQQIALYQRNKSTRDGFASEYQNSCKHKESLESDLEYTRKNTPKNPNRPSEDKGFGNAVAMLTGGIVIALFIFHCIIWILKFIFDISWNTWGWTVNTFFWGLGITIISYIGNLIYNNNQMNKYEEIKSLHDSGVEKQKELKKSIKKENNNIDILMRQYCNSLFNDFKDIVEIPIKEKAILNSNLEECEEYLKDIVDIKDAVNRADKKTVFDLKKKLANKKLEVFYKVSIEDEASYENVVREFEEQTDNAIVANNINLLRQDYENSTLEFIKNDNEFQSKLAGYVALLNDNKMTPILNDLTIIQNLDTKGIFNFTSVDKLTAQTQKVQEIYQAISLEYNELTKINDIIGLILDYVRTCAFRNIYLGIELLNYVRDNAGGKSLTKQQDYVDVQQQDTGIEIDGADLSVDITGNILKSVDSLYNTFYSNRNIHDFAVKNPKMAAGVAVAAIVSNYLGERNAKIENNTNAQEEMINAISQMADGYSSGQASLLRAIEIIRSITKSNNGFMAVYTPLKEKVFDKNHPSDITMEDVQALARATKDYNDISKSKL
jgi:hypothetical protein